MPYLPQFHCQPLSGEKNSQKQKFYFAFTNFYRSFSEASSHMSVSGHPEVSLTLWVSLSDSSPIFQTLHQRCGAVAAAGATVASTFCQEPEPEYYSILFIYLFPLFRGRSHRRGLQKCPRLHITVFNSLSLTKAVA